MRSLEYLVRRGIDILEKAQLCGGLVSTNVHVLAPIDTKERYERQDDPHPLTWVYTKMAGANDSIINLKEMEIVVKNSFMMIRTGLGQEPQKYKSTELAVLLGWQYDDWHGTPIKKLLTTTELKNMEAGRMIWGFLRLEDMLKNPEKGNGRKRMAEKTEKTTTKMARSELANEEE
ncbi:hypothetical protein GCK32_002402 [Trichostrongylus colubriformis]|uniref:Uncharacterized protein n=1 Tax=Trichostrongylus colubriformis TaxID=6319 RepID=A0AAN8FGI7_TRICO